MSKRYQIGVAICVLGLIGLAGQGVLYLGYDSDTGTHDMSPPVEIGMHVEDLNLTDIRRLDNDNGEITFAHFDLGATVSDEPTCNVIVFLSPTCHGFQLQREGLPWVDTLRVDAGDGRHTNDVSAVMIGFDDSLSNVAGGLRGLSDRFDGLGVGYTEDAAQQGLRNLPEVWTMEGNIVRDVYRGSVVGQDLELRLDDCSIRDS